MKTIIIIRHAKSSWDNILLKDFDRTLNQRGMHDAPMMGKRLANRKIKIDKILSSSSIRTTQTIEFIATEINYPINNILFLKELYHASASTINDVIETIDDSINTAIIVCHNNGITNWVNSQIGYIIDNVPTCGMVAFTVNINSWLDYSNAQKNLLFIDFPKNNLE